MRRALVLALAIGWIVFHIGTYLVQCEVNIDDGVDGYVLFCGNGILSFHHFTEVVDTSDKPMRLYLGWDEQLYNRDPLLQILGFGYEYLSVPKGSFVNISSIHQIDLPFWPVTLSLIALCVYELIHKGGRSGTRSVS